MVLRFLNNIKNKIKQKSQYVFNASLAHAQISMLTDFLMCPSWWNPNQEEVFDGMWAIPHLNQFLDDFATMVHNVPVTTDFGLVSIGFTYYSEYHYRINFAPHNPRVLTINLIDIFPSETDVNGDRIEYEDDSKLKQFQDIANEYNKLDMRHLVRVGVLDDGFTPVLRISSQIVFTSEFGDKMTIKEACDELIEYAVRFVRDVLKNQTPHPDQFNQNLFLPTKTFEVKKFPDYYQDVENALGHWFGMHTQAVFGLRNVVETEKTWSQKLPINQILVDGAKAGEVVVKLPVGEDEIIQKFHSEELARIRLIVPKKQPYLYTIESHDLKYLFQVGEHTSQKEISEIVRAICVVGNWNDHNQLVKFIWDKKEDGSLDFSLITSGLWAGPGQSFAKIEQIGEFMKNLSMVKYALQQQSEKGESLE